MTSRESSVDLSIYSVLKTLTCEERQITCETESVACVALLILFVFPSLRLLLISLILIASQLYQPPSRKPSTQSLSLSGCWMAGCLRRPSPPVKSLQTTCTSSIPPVTSVSRPTSLQGFIIHMQRCFAVEMVRVLDLAASPGVTLRLRRHLSSRLLFIFRVMISQNADTQTF